MSNKYGNIWYQILSGPYAGYYIFSGETEFVEYVDDLSITGNTFPSNIAQGVDYKPSEVIKSRHRITSVFGAIGLKDGGKTKDVYNASVKPEVHDSYSIVGSPISDALKFDQLTPGNYNYAILVSAIADFYTQEKGADIGEGITRLTSESFWKDYQREFTVYHEHNYGGWVHDSVNHWQECTCGDKTDMAEHSFGEWTVTKEASTTEPGSKTRSCSVCGFEETLEIPVLSHTHSYGTDWKNNETSHWHECTCGDKADMAAHSFRWIIDRAATATQKGSKHEECTVCGYRRAAVEIPATGTTTGGTTGGGSHWHPSVTTTPVPVIVVPPKTGDMTIWQSILHFLGIR